MSDAVTRSLRCLGPAWLFAWVAAVFVPGLIFTAKSLVKDQRGDILSVLASIWNYADDISPFAKLAVGLLLAIGLLLTTQLNTRSVLRHAIASVFVGVLSVGLTLGLLPQIYSSGFGIGLTGQRFDPDLLPAYAVGAICAGVVFTLVSRACGSRNERLD